MLRLGPPMGHQVADEAAGGLELLSWLRRRGSEQVVTQKVAVSPLSFVPGQPQAVQPASDCCVYRRVLLSVLRHDCNLVRGDCGSSGRLIDRSQLQSGCENNSSNRHEYLTCEGAGPVRASNSAHAWLCPLPKM